MASTLERIKSRGYWHIVIRPVSYNAKLVSDISELKSIIEKSSVQLRGWDFPHIESKDRYVVGVDWTGQEAEWGGFLEVWRAYQSGQFVDYTGMEEDWSPHHSGSWGQTLPDKYLKIGNALFTFTEIMEFASRLSLTPMGSEEMFVSTVVSGLASRQLVVDSSKRLPLHPVYAATLESLPLEIQVKRETLVGDAWTIARRWCSELLKRFGMSISDDGLREWQEELRRFRT